MIKKGLLDEVKGFHGRPDMHCDLPAMRAVGYRQLWQHLDGEHSFENACDRAVTATRQLAKRQMTWLRSESEVNWITLQDGARVQQEVIHAG